MIRTRIFHLILAVTAFTTLTQTASAAQSCADPALRLMPQVPAMVTVTLTAPCHPRESVTIAHSGLRFSALTNDQGQLTLALPALSTPAQVDMTLTDGTRLTASAPVADLADVARLALVPVGLPGLHLRAARPGTSPPISSTDPGQPNLATGGFLTLLGDPTAGPQAELLTLPVATGTSPARLLAAVDAANCGHDLLAMTFRLQPDGTLAAGALTLAMPACTAPGKQIDIAIDSLPAPAP